METPFVELKAISKRFPGVKALDGVSLSFFAGEVHAVMGENGAGKSTLMKILAGSQPPDGGEIRISGRTEVIDNPIRARELRIGMVYQEFSLLDNLDVARNLLLGREPLCGRKLIDRRRLYRRAGVIKAMAGRSVADVDARSTGKPGTNMGRGHQRPRLEVNTLALNGRAGNITFSVAPGEIMGIGGLIGSGRTALAETIFGLRRPCSGAIFVDGAPLKAGRPAAAMRAGLAYVPDDRKGLGLVLTASVVFNLTVTLLARISRLGFRRAVLEARLYDRWRRELAIRAPSGNHSVSTLSGGNQQKVVLAKWLARTPGVLMLNEPTRGIDVGAKADVHAIVRRIAGEGVAVVMISSELPELLALSDRIMVMCRGRQMGILDVRDASEERVLGLAFGDGGGTV